MKQLDLNLIKQKRIEKGFSIADMSTMLGFKDPSTYWNYENGKYKFKANMLPILADAFSCNINYFFN